MSDVPQWHSPDCRAFARAVRKLLALDLMTPDAETIDELRATVADARLARMVRLGLVFSRPPAECPHNACTVVMQRGRAVEGTDVGPSEVVLWCRRCGALGWPGEWRLPGGE